ncbi:MAG: hypothetical protein ABFR50_04335 [Candidatus Fermentibacteria bacterium]
MEPLHKSRLRALILIWAALLVLVFGGRMYTTDVLAQYEVAGSFTGQRSFMTVSGDFGWIIQGTRPGLFVPHGAGFSILLIPAAIAGQFLGLNGGKLVIALLNAGFSLALIGFWYASAVKKSSDVPVLRFTAIAVCGMALVYGKITFDVTAAAAAVMAGFYFYLNDRLFTAGLCLGFAILVRADSLLLLPLFWTDLKGMKKIISGLVPFILLLLFLNWYRFGNPFLDGHGQDPAIVLEPFKGGIPGLLFSPGKGLLFYAPLCIFALFFQKDWRLWTPFALSLIFHGMLHDWSGGTGWGPRFLFTTLPFLLLPLSFRGAGGKLFRVIAILGIIICIPAFWSNPSLLEQASGADLFDEPSRQAVLWSWSSSPLISTFRNFSVGVPDIFCATAAASVGKSIWTGVLAQITAASVLAAAGILALRKSRQTGKSAA